MEWPEVPGVACSETHPEELLLFVVCTPDSKDLDG